MLCTQTDDIDQIRHTEFEQHCSNSQCTFIDSAPALFSKRQRITLRLLYAMSRLSVVCLSVCRLSSVVCDVGAPYSGG